MAVAYCIDKSSCIYFVDCVNTIYLSKSTISMKSFVIAFSNVKTPDSKSCPILHTKFQSHQSIGSGENFLKVFTINGHGDHVDQVTQTM